MKTYAGKTILSEVKVWRNKEFEGTWDVDGSTFILDGRTSKYKYDFYGDDVCVFVTINNIYVILNCMNNSMRLPNMDSDRHLAKMIDNAAELLLWMSKIKCMKFES